MSAIEPDQRPNFEPDANFKPNQRPDLESTLGLNFQSNLVSSWKLSCTPKALRLVWLGTNFKVRIFFFSWSLCSGSPTSASTTSPTGAQFQLFQAPIQPELQAPRQRQPELQRRATPTTSRTSAPTLSVPTSAPTTSLTSAHPTTAPTGTT